MKGLVLSMSLRSRILPSLGLGWLLCLNLCAQSVLPVDVGTTVNGFQDNFTGSGLGANWVVCGANV